MISLKNIDGGREFDWGKASEDYAKYRDIYPDEFYARIAGLGLCTEGQTVLDLGTGTGVLPRHMAKYGAKFIGADISENQIGQARRLSKEAGLDIKYIVSPAEALDFHDNSFDVVTACQCFMYFDLTILLPKLYRMLKDGGRLCVLFMAWLPDEDELAKGSEQLVLKYNPDWDGAGMKRCRAVPPESLQGLFTVKNNIAYDIAVPFTRESWNGRIKACRGIGASNLSEDEIARFEREHLEYLEKFPPVFEIPHYVTILDLEKLKH